MKLEGRVALVTGGAQGIGRAVALAMAREGADVAIADLDEKRAQLTLGEFEQLGVLCAALPVDVSDSASVTRMFAECVTRLGKVDILVNNAALMSPTRGFEISDNEWSRVVDVNLKGVFLCSKVALPPMMERGWGRVINMSSASAFNGSGTGDLAYAASKGGVVSLTRGFARLAASRSVTVNAIAPGPIDTEIQTRTGRTTQEEWRAFGAAAIPMGRIGSPDDVAGAIMFLASDDASFITGATIAVSGGSFLH